MPVSVPTKTDGSIGRAKTDAPGSVLTSLDYQVPAAEYERVKDAIIDIATYANTIGGGGVLNNLTATTDPAASSDSSLGYSAGSLWLRAQGSPPSAGFGVWICRSAGVGIADWRRIQALNSLAQTLAPTSSEDANDGYAVGSIYGGAQIGFFVCTNADTGGSAAWARITLLNNYAASIGVPGASDDSTQGYSIGSRWYDTSVPSGGYVCLIATVGAAIWLPFPVAKDAIEDVGATSSAGIDPIGFARIDHVHAHGSQASSNTMHAVVIAAGNAGFMSGVDKAKLDGVAAGAVATSASAPANVGTAAGGVAGTASRSDHVHAHGNQLGGALHADAIAAGASGFLSGADKTKIDNILQPASRVVSATTDTAAAGDIGNVTFVSQAATCTVTLPTLAGSLIAGRMLLLTWQCEGAATALVITPSGSVNIDGSASNYVALTGQSRVSLMSRDGLNWFSGTP